MSSTLTTNVICINLDHHIPTNGYLISGCLGVVAEKKSQVADGVCVIREDISKSNDRLYSLIYLDVKTFAPGKYHYQCLSNQGSVLSNEIVACKFIVILYNIATSIPVTQ